MKKTGLMHIPLDPDRPILEQLEERAALDDEDLSLPEKKIYQNPERIKGSSPIFNRLHRQRRWIPCEHQDRHRVWC